MSTTDDPRHRQAPPSAARARIISAALELFARHGVGGTSLGMIADELGVTKAAVYHQYRTRDEIVLAVAEAELARMEATIDDAEEEQSWAKARERLLNNMVSLAVQRRRTMRAVLMDPEIVRFAPRTTSYRRVMSRMNRLLIGNSAGPETAARTATLIAVISGTAVHPLVADLDDEDLRAQLLPIVQRFLEEN
ncbi:TetR/AcrR family transcriptional regulator [Streptomyces geranii]|uniref:TetR/AcrR family transcriptional regulator n=1 Tax=Streptomyces geranii TaxID=2058923 RepID=UPI0018E59C13|nr:TetR/AcrR family transcriptional regulator [Streptomyces geranii]